MPARRQLRSFAFTLEGRVSKSQIITVAEDGFHQAEDPAHITKIRIVLQTFATRYSYGDRRKLLDCGAKKREAIYHAVQVGVESGVALSICIILEHIPTVRRRRVPCCYTQDEPLWNVPQGRLQRTTTERYGM